MNFYLKNKCRFKEVRYNCSAHRSVDLFIIARILESLAGLLAGLSNILDNSNK